MDQAEAADGLTLRLPPEAARALGLRPGSRLDLAVRRGRVELRPDIHSLARLYIEPTSRCNLSCLTCVRLAEGLKDFPHLESAMLGGFGEPLLHPDILAMAAALKERGLAVEMVSNGTLLDEAMGKGLIEAGLDRLWLSFDGAQDPSFEHVREGASFKAVVANARRLRDLVRESGRGPRLGIAFVVTRGNIAELKDLGKLARKLGADRVSVSNVIPTGPEMERQMVCGRTLTLGLLAKAPEKTVLDLPRMDLDPAAKEALWHLISSGEELSLMGEALGASAGECRFIRERCAFLRWDGKVVPCLGRMHSHESYFYGMPRKNRAHLLGDLRERSLREVWDAPDYAAFREKVAAFDFSPCHVCGGCDLVDENERDCAGNAFPATCGGCLWGRGVVQCP
jgi:MoaA/NifB/PqqE/SkfB family radical SAM enzyme